MLALDEVVEGAILHRDVHVLNVGDNGRLIIPHELVVALRRCQAWLLGRRVAGEVVGEAAAGVAPLELDVLDAPDVTRVLFLPRMAMLCCAKSLRR